MLSWQDMTAGGKAALILVLFFILIVIIAAIYSFVGLFIGGALETAAMQSDFYYVNASNHSEGLTQVGTGFGTVVTNMISNINLANSPIQFFATLLIVIMVLAVFGGLFYIVWKNKKSGKGGSDMSY